MRKRRMDAMFMGEYNHSIDAKGRMIVPAKFREQLGNEFVVTKGLDGCLFVYSNEEWHRFQKDSYKNVGCTEIYSTPSTTVVCDISFSVRSDVLTADTGSCMAKSPS